MTAPKLLCPHIQTFAMAAAYPYVLVCDKCRDSIAEVLEAAVAWVDCMKPGTVSPVGSLRKAAVALDEAVRAAREKGVIA